MNSPRVALQSLSPQWLILLLIIRVTTAATAVVLLAIHRVTDHDGTLIAAVSIYTALVVAVCRWAPTVVLRPAVWIVDTVAVLALVAASEDWRSPFYLMAVTSLAAPAAALSPLHAAAAGSGFSVVYVVVAHFIGPDPLSIGTQTTVETLATHLVLPILVCFGVSYAADVVRRLRAERRRAERLAIEAERRRIAWELHGSAKQRVNAAHLVLSSVTNGADDRLGRALQQVLEELRCARADMDTSLAELVSPLEGRPLAAALRERAAALTVEGGPVITVSGEAPPLKPLQEAHAYRVAAEALSNAVRHAAAEHVEVKLESHAGLASVTVADDGIGIPETTRLGSNGLRSMRNRAATIGGELRIAPADSGRGTRVELRFPINDRRGAPA